MTQSTALPDFEGKPVHKTKVKITNAGDGLTEALSMAPKAYHSGDEVYLVVKAVITEINHKPEKDSDAMIRVHTAKALEATEVAEPAAASHLATARETLRVLRDEAVGQESLLDGKDEPAAKPRSGRRASVEGTPVDDQEAELADYARKRNSGSMTVERDDDDRS